jgi:hypothetical protein
MMTLQWQFSLPVPLTTLKTSLNSLAALQQSIGQRNSGWSLTLSAEQLQASATAQAAQPCPTADLLADAQEQAQKLVSASPELSVGPILALSDGTGVANPGAAVTGFVFFETFGAGDFGIVNAFAPTPTCTLAVKFALLRYQ